MDGDVVTEAVRTPLVTPSPPHAKALTKPHSRKHGGDETNSLDYEQQGLAWRRPQALRGIGV